MQNNRAMCDTELNRPDCLCTFLPSQHRQADSVPPFCEPSRRARTKMWNPLQR